MTPTDAIPHPSDWSIATVGQDIDIKRGVSWSKDQEYKNARDGAVPVIGISNVQQKLELASLLYLSGVRPAVVEKTKVSAGWSVIVGSNGNRKRVGNAVFIREDTDFMFASFLLAARPKTMSPILPEYFYRWLSERTVMRPALPPLTSTRTNSPAV